MNTEMGFCLGEGDPKRKVTILIDAADLINDLLKEAGDSLFDGNAENREMCMAMFKRLLDVPVVSAFDGYKEYAAHDVAEVLVNLFEEARNNNAID